MIVIDASVLVNVLADDGDDGALARDHVARTDLHAPELVDVETVSALRRRWMAGDLSDERFALALDDLEVLELERFPALPLMRRAYELRANVTAYDAAYVALAEVLRCPLVTADARLARAPGIRCEVKVLRQAPPTPPTPTT